MGEYIERRTAIEHLNVWCGGCGSAVECILAEPAADVAPVVRCKVCEYSERYERINETAGYYCGHPQNSFTYGERWDRVFKPAKEADDFCSYGERKRE